MKKSLVAAVFLAVFCSIAVPAMAYETGASVAKAISAEKQMKKPRLAVAKVNLNVGQRLNIKGYTNAKTCLLHLVQADVNNDGAKEKLLITGDIDNMDEACYIQHENIRLIVLDSKNKVLSSSYLIDCANSSGHTVSVGNMLGDNKKELLISLYTGGRDASENAFVFTYANGKLVKIPFTPMETVIDCNLKTDNTVAITCTTGNFKKNYKLDLSTHEGYAENNGFATSFWGSSEGPGYSIKDYDNDGSFELVETKFLAGDCHADRVAKYDLVYKYVNKKWETVDAVLESDYLD